MYKIKLTSDFRDWYDHIFYSNHEKCDAEIIRIAHDKKYSIGKPEQFNILGKRLKLNVPIHGYVQDWATRISPDTYVVVYHDEFEVRKVKCGGYIKLHGHPIYTTRQLVGEYVGLEPLNHDRWQLYFGLLKLGVIDERIGRVIRPT